VVVVVVEIVVDVVLGRRLLSEGKAFSKGKGKGGGGGGGRELLLMRGVDSLDINMLARLVLGLLTLSLLLRLRLARNELALIVGLVQNSSFIPSRSSSSLL
jgi:hypothetical protein